MTLLVYFVRRAVEAMWRKPIVTVVATATIFVAVLVTGACAAALTAGERLALGWAGDVSISVYLAPEADLDAARAAVAAAAPGRRVTAIPSARALERLRDSLGKDATLLDGVDAAALPASIEVSAAGLQLADVRALAQRLSRVPGARDVDDGNAWIEGLDGTLSTVRAIGMILFGALALGTAVLVSNTLRLGVFARRDEIEIMKLVGGTDTFVQAPFWLEGLFQGVIGSALAIGALLGAHAIIAPRVSVAARLGSALDRAQLLPTSLLAMLAISGAVLGLVSSAIAVRRHALES
ncbi:MAG TPA: permease-like cell division protein FtsX [Anaeromyxobacteraceae bacterium]|nr:permease-like cell division protein FtsX [Anaeromyxobacteraceae bacterium]